MTHFEEQVARAWLSAMRQAHSGQITTPEDIEDVELTDGAVIDATKAVIEVFRETLIC